ncbi:cytochrome b [Caballeronia glebae]|uniref:cytochrome b n=1 Tax=Caballeronia glebae TaxID=1777143 RepID=UPI0038B8D818
MQRPARALHWLTALLLLIQFVLALTMPDVNDDTKPIGLIAWHLGIGMAIVFLAAIRVLWRSMNTVPPESVSLPMVLRILAGFTHSVLYALLLVIPLMGWANASSRGWAITLLGAIPMPALSPVGSPLGHALGDWHATLACVLLGLIGTHIVGALYHPLFLRDRTLNRMLPGLNE